MTIIILSALVAVSCFVMLGSVFMLYRNRWVLKQRLRLIVQDLDRYRQFPSYDHMLWHVWVWDVERFAPRGDQP